MIREALRGGLLLLGIGLAMIGVGWGSGAGIGLEATMDRPEAYLEVGDPLLVADAPLVRGVVPVGDPRTGSVTRPASARWWRPAAAGCSCSPGGARAGPAEPAAPADDCGAPDATDGTTTRPVAASEGVRRCSR